MPSTAPTTVQFPLSLNPQAGRPRCHACDERAFTFANGTLPQCRNHAS